MTRIVFLSSNRFVIIIDEKFVYSAPCWTIPSGLESDEEIIEHFRPYFR